MGAGATTDVTEVIDAFFTKLTSGEIEAAMEHIHPENVIEEPDGLPYAGEYVGPGGLAELFGKVTSLYGFEIHDWHVEPFRDGAICHLNATFTSLESGEAKRMQVVEIYEFTDGKMSHATVFPQDTKVITELAATG